MKAVVQDFINLRNPQSLQEYDRALRELIQHLVLLGLWRAGFFEHAAFYGGTALRILRESSTPRYCRFLSRFLFRYALYRCPICLPEKCTVFSLDDGRTE